MLIWADDFRMYGEQGVDTAADALEDGVYAQARPNSGSNGRISIVEDPDPTSELGSLAIQFPAPAGGTNSAGHPFLRYAIPDTAKTTLGCSFRVFIDSLPTVAGRGLHVRFNDVANNNQVGFYVQTTGGFRAYVAGTTLGDTVGPAITAAGWYHIEAKAVIDNEAGSFEIRVNGKEVFKQTGVNTQGTDEEDVAQVVFTIQQSDFAGGGKTYIKDFVVWDSTGSANNDFMGPVYVLRRTVTSDVALNWTPSTGSTGYTLLAATPANDLEYISADETQLTPSEFALQDLPEDATSVRGIIMVGRLWSSDGGDCEAQMALKSNGASANGQDRQLTPAATFWYDVVELSPDTGVAFTPTEFNNTTITLARTAL